MLNAISFTLDSGNHLAILGESGCGKSTLLHLIYGLLPLGKAKILWGETQLKGPEYSLIPGELDMKLVSQELDLMPFTTVKENIAEHLNRRDKLKDAQRVDELLDVVELSAFKNTKVGHLSGGQKQRVAIAKALAKAPKLLLLDEPFSSIDNFMKNRLRRKLFRYLKSNAITCISATHDSEEALAYSDTLIILKEGTILNMGTPQEVYNNCTTVYEASFFGEVSIVENQVYLPHQLKISKEKTSLQAKVVACYFKGDHFLIEAIDNKNNSFYVKHTLSINPQANVNITLKGAH